MVVVFELARWLGTRKRNKRCWDRRPRKAVHKKRTKGHKGDTSLRLSEKPKRNKR
jgi:hypothetical protein